MDNHDPPPGGLNSSGKTLPSDPDSLLYVLAYLPGMRKQRESGRGSFVSDVLGCTNVATLDVHVSFF